MEWLSDYRRNINNPVNITGFRLLMNKEYFKENMTNEKLEEMENNITKKKMVQPEPKHEPIKIQVSKVMETKPIKFDYIGFKDYDETKDKEETIEDQLKVIEKERLKSDIRKIIVQLKMIDSKTSYESYFKLMENNRITESQLERIYQILSEELASHEGRTFVKDGIVALCSLGESLFDGSVNVFGRYPNLEGYSDLMEVSLRKRKIETARIHRNIQEKIGLGPMMQIAIDGGFNALITLKRNAAERSSVSDAIKTKKNLDY